MSAPDGERPPSPAPAAVPVVVWAGFLGAGKTTVLQGVLARLPPALRVLTLVNDLSPDNVDERSLRAAGAGAGAGRALRPLSGGCVCCNLLGELVAELAGAAAAGYDLVMLECTGVADVHPVAATVGALPALRGRARLEAVVTVVHADALRRAEDAATGAVDMSVADARGQLEGCSVALINCWEAVAASAAQARRWAAAVEAHGRRSNPRMRVLFTDGGRFDYFTHVHGRRLAEADGTLALHLRRYAEGGRALGAAPAAGEEAAELRDMGLEHFTARLPPAAAPPSIAALRAAASGPAGRRLLAGVWRSKGFFAAADDEAAGGAAGAPAVKVFCWQTVRRRLDYAEVLLPPGAPPPESAIVFIGRFRAAAKEREVQSFFASIRNTCAPKTDG